MPPPPRFDRGGSNAPSTTLRVVPLPRFAGEDQRSAIGFRRGRAAAAAALILPRLRGRGTMRSMVEGAQIRGNQALGRPFCSGRAPR
jgi:hypothetical protein